MAKKKKERKISLFINWHSIFNFLVFLAFTTIVYIAAEGQLFPTTTDISTLYDGFTLHKDYGVFIFSWNDLAPKYLFLIFLFPVFAAAFLSYYYPYRSKRLFIWIPKFVRDPDFREVHWIGLLTVFFGWCAWLAILDLTLLFLLTSFPPSYQSYDGANEIYGKEKTKLLTSKIIRECKQSYPQGIVIAASNRLEGPSSLDYPQNIDRMSDRFFERNIHPENNILCVKNKEILEQMRDAVKKESDAYYQKNDCKVKLKKVTVRNKLGGEWQDFKPSLDCSELNFNPLVPKSIFSGKWSPN